MKKHTFVGKNYEDAVNKAKIELQDLEYNLIKHYFLRNVK